MSGAEPITEQSRYLAQRRAPRTNNPRDIAPEPLDPVLYSLRMRRLELGISQAALAVQLCVTQAAISEWERGFYSPTLRTMRRWSDALDMTIVAAQLPFSARDAGEIA